MNTFFKYILISSAVTLFVTAFFLSCKKNKPITITISGRISDPNQNNKSIADAVVSIYQKKLDNGSYNTNYKFITSTTTDAGGLFDLAFTKDNVIDYKIIVEKENYFLSETIYNPDKISTQQNNILNYSIYPKSWIKVHFRSDNPFNSNDKLSFSYYENLLETCTSCCTYGPKTFIGNDIDTIIKCETWAYKTVSYQAFIIKNGVSNIRNGTIYTPQGDTAMLDFYY